MMQATVNKILDELGRRAGINIDISAPEYSLVIEWELMELVSLYIPDFLDEAERMLINVSLGKVA